MNRGCVLRSLLKAKGRKGEAFLMQIFAGCIFFHLDLLPSFLPCLRPTAWSDRNSTPGPSSQDRGGGGGGGGWRPLRYCKMGSRLPPSGDNLLFPFSFFLSSSYEREEPPPHSPLVFFPLSRKAALSPPAPTGLRRRSGLFLKPMGREERECWVCVCVGERISLLSNQCERGGPEGKRVVIERERGRKTLTFLSAYTPSQTAGRSKKSSSLSLFVPTDRRRLLPPIAKCDSARRRKK